MKSLDSGRLFVLTPSGLAYDKAGNPIPELNTDKLRQRNGRPRHRVRVAA